jgi:hypothetical protein
LVVGTALEGGSLKNPVNNDFLLVSQFSVTGAGEMTNEEFRLSN